MLNYMCLHWVACASIKESTMHMHVQTKDHGRGIPLRADQMMMHMIRPRTLRQYLARLRSFSLVVCARFDRAGSFMVSFHSLVGYTPIGYPHGILQMLGRFLSLQNYQELTYLMRL
jgi:hypothetical protein